MFKVKKRVRRSISFDNLRNLQEAIGNILGDGEPTDGPRDPYEGMTPREKFVAMVREEKARQHLEEKARREGADGEDSP